MKKDALLWAAIVIVIVAVYGGMQFGLGVTLPTDNFAPMRSLSSWQFANPEVSAQALSKGLEIPPVAYALCWIGVSVVMLSCLFQLHRQRG